jgi:hypothetical protein
MAKSPCSQLLGEILREADLVTEAQIQVALQDQKYSPLPLGEILVVRGWLEQETVDFFAESWPRMVQTRARRPLGYYLQQAYLLREDQVNLILEEQRKLGIRFGSVAVLKGWIKQKTLDYFLDNLIPEAKTSSAFQGKQFRTDAGFRTDTRLQPETAHNTNSCPLNRQSQKHRVKTAGPSTDHNSNKISLNPFASKSKASSQKSTHNSFVTNSNREDFDLAAVLEDNGKSTAERDWEENIWVD